MCPAFFLSNSERELERFAEAIEVQQRQESTGTVCLKSVCDWFVVLCWMLNVVFAFTEVIESGVCNLASKLSLSLSPVVCVHYAGERKQKCKHTQKDQLVWIWVGRARWLINLLACLHSQFPLMWLNLFFVVVVSCLSWAVFWTDQSGNWFRFCVLVFSIFCRCCCRLTFDGFRFSVVVVVCMFYSLVKLLAGFVEVLL